MEHHEKYPTQKKYEYYIGDRKLEGNFKVVGQFENLTFIEHNLNVNYREFRKISSLWSMIRTMKNLKSQKFRSLKRRNTRVSKMDI